MREDIKSYADSLINDVPHSVYEVLLTLMCIGIILFLTWKGRRAGRYIAGLLLVEYSFLLYCSTVIYRKALPEREFDLMPFWSYTAIQEGKEELLVENLMNVVVFVPVGLLLGFMVNGSWLKVKRAWLIVLMTGLVISVSIEAMQYFFHKGFAETDDVIHNTLGCMIGYGIYALARYGYERLIHIHG